MWQRGAVALIAFIALAPDADAGQVEIGHQLARDHCSRCHVVEADNRFSGISSTPSFMMMVDHLDDWQDRFATFYARLPHPSVIFVDGIDPPTDQPPSVVPIELSLDDVEAILAYAKTLQTAE